MLVPLKDILEHVLAIFLFTIIWIGFVQYILTPKSTYNHYHHYNVRCSEVILIKYYIEIHVIFSTLDIDGTQLLLLFVFKNATLFPILITHLIIIGYGKWCAVLFCTLLPTKRINNSTFYVALTLRNKSIFINPFWSNRITFHAR